MYLFIYVFFKAERGLFGCWFGRPHRGGIGEPQAHPLPQTHPRSRTLPTQPNSQQDLARVFGAEAGEETCPAHPGEQAGMAGCPPPASAPACANERVTQQGAFILC